MKRSWVFVFLLSDGVVLNFVVPPFQIITALVKFFCHENLDVSSR